jgi:nonribosomal peptide synthetase DhbF
MASCIHLHGRIERDLLEKSLRQAIGETFGLHVLFLPHDSPSQRAVPPDGWTLRHIHLDPGSDANEWMRQRLLRSYDVASPLIDFVLLQLGSDESILYLGYHQLVLDVYGLELLIKRCADVYSASSSGTNPGPSPFGSFTSYLAEEINYQRSAESVAAHDYFAQRFEDMPAAMRLPDAEEARTHSNRQRAVEVPHTGLNAQPGGSAKAQWQSLLASVLAVYIARMSNVHDVSVSIAFDGRVTDLAKVIPARMANVLPLRLHIPSHATWADVHGSVIDATSQLERYQRYRGGDVRREAIERDSRMSFGAVVSVLAQDAALRFGEHHARLVHLVTDRVADLALCRTMTAAGPAIELHADSGLHGPAEMDGHRDRIAALLAAATADRGGRVWDTDMVTEHDRERSLRRWNDTAAPLPELTVPQAFEQQAAATPGAVALETGAETVSYAQLSSRADALAWRLARAGARPGNTVGILMQRSADLVVTLLAVAKTGAAYVPLDPRFPVWRMRAILLAVDARILVADRTTIDHEIAAGQTVVRADAEDAADAGYFADRTRGNDALLYIMHTSGSTGEPKGAEITHKNVLALALDRKLRGPAHQRVLFHSPHAFDASTYEIWTPLLSGGRVVISPQAIDALVLRRLASSGGVTAVFLTSGLLAALAQGDPGCLEGVREVWTGGEVVPPWAVDRIRDACPEVAVFNVYGPTENTTFSTCYRIPPGPLNGRELPIGAPMDNTKVYVLDENFRLAPPGAIGHVYVGGARVARGYSGKPTLTAGRFLPDPFGSPGSRMYASGDLGSWDADGYLRFRGRADDQVKLHGFRVEPSEIESALLRYSGVSQAAVVIHKRNENEGRIVAFVVLDADATADSKQLREHLTKRLPDYMVPAEIILLPEMPFNRNGKVDRVRLSEFPTTGSAGPADWPATATEKMLRDLWEELLEVPVTSGDASFWDLGGDSVLGFTLVAQMRERLGAKLRLRDLFQSPRLADLARFVDAADTAHDEQAACAAERELAASEFQRRIWLAEKLEPTPGLYNIPLAWRVPGRLDRGRLALAVAKVVQRHEVLRTTFREGPGGSLLQVIGAPWQPIIPEERCDDDADLAAALHSEANHPFDLTTGPLLKVRVIDTRDGQILTVTVHHLVFDGASVALFMSEVRRYYAGEDSAAAPSQYREFMQAREQADQAGADQAGLGRRAQQLLGAPSRLPLPAPARAEPHGRVPLKLPDDVLQQIRPLQERHGMSWFMVAAAALAAVLHRRTESDDLTLGFGADIRPGREFATVMGPCLNMIVVRSRCRASTTVAELLTATRDRVLEALDDKDVAFEAIVDRLNPRRSAGSTPYMDVVLAPQGRSSAPDNIDGLRLSQLPLPEGAGTIGKFAALVSLEATEDKLTGTLLYRGDRLSAVGATTLASQFARALELVAGSPDQTIGTLDLTDTDARAMPDAEPAGKALSPQAIGARPAASGTRTRPAASPEDLHERVVAIWSSLLESAYIGPDDNFFDCGGNSLKLVTLHAELCREFGLELPIQRLMDNSTVRSMARLLTNSGGVADPVNSTMADRGTAPVGTLHPER